MCVTDRQAAATTQKLVEQYPLVSTAAAAAPVAGFWFAGTLCDMKFCENMKKSKSWKRLKWETGDEDRRMFSVFYTRQSRNIQLNVVSFI